MQGIDSRVRNVKNKGACVLYCLLHHFLVKCSAKSPLQPLTTPLNLPAGQSAYLVTFGRAGEDNKKFKLGDIEQTLQGGLICPSGKQLRCCVQILC